MEDNIVCTNKVRMVKSMINQAGRDALYNCGVVFGYMVMCIPLIHIPNRYWIKMCREEVVMTTKICLLKVLWITKSIMGQQPLLNDCHGYTGTLYLMCPYGTSFSLANHYQACNNIEQIWDELNWSIHRPEDMQRTL